MGMVSILNGDQLASSILIGIPAMLTLAPFFLRKPMLPFPTPTMVRVNKGAVVRILPHVSVWKMEIVETSVGGRTVKC